ncbi:arginase family protein [Ruegeria haliotis]|uniref:arginase family protein n=1 Tax=Ruegeria haliotis TaxID=2747601 RepID=UPI002E2E6885|nr:arginase family protein [Ruegeria haliotis]
MLVGVPHSTGITERDQHPGSRALRNASLVAGRVHGGFQLDPWQAAKIADVDNVPFPRATDNKGCIEQITKLHSDIDAAGACPILVGGDIVCMMPATDSPDQITALTASVIMFEMVPIVAENVKAENA